MLHEFLIMLFLAGTTGDAYTTFIGIVSGLGGNYNNIGTLLFAGMGTATVTGFNVMTNHIFRRKILVLVPLWLLAISFDFITSFLGSEKFVTVNTGYSLYLRILITIFITSSPAMLNYIVQHKVGKD